MFRRINKRFEGTGGVSSLIREPIRTTRTETRIDAVRQCIEGYGTRSINLAVVDLGLLFGMIWQIL